MNRAAFDRAQARHDLEIDRLRDAWLRGFTLEQRMRLGLQQEYLERVRPKPSTS